MTHYFAGLEDQTHSETLFGKCFILSLVLPALQVISSDAIIHVLYDLIMSLSRIFLYFFICKLKYLLFLLNLISNMTYVDYWWLHGYWCPKLSLICKKLYSKFLGKLHNNKWLIYQYYNSFLLINVLVVTLIL
jgi:hypothetical protein